MAIALERKIITKSKKCNVDVNLAYDDHRGEKILQEKGKKNTTIILEASRKIFLDIFMKTLQ